jgi:MFS transporter, DHA3 family, macrolide efflux protein
MRILAPLRLPQLALLWGGLALSAVGDQLYVVALSWIAVGVLGPAAGYLSALGAAAVLITALIGGHWADCCEQRTLMMSADLIRAAALIVLVAIWNVLERPSAAGLVIVVVVLACGQAVFRPALQSLIPVLVAEVRLLPASNALFDATDRIARLLGPGLVGLMAAFIPAKHFLSLDAASFAISAVALLLIPRVFPVPPIRHEGPPFTFPTAMARGFRAVLRHRLLGFVLKTNGVVNGMWYATFFLAVPLIINRHGVTGPGGTGLAAYGLVISAYGCTNLLGTLIVGGRGMPANPAPLIFCGNVMLGSGILLLALTEALGLPHGWLLPAYVASAAIAAFGGPMQDIPTAVLRQTEIPRVDLPAATRAFLVMANAGMLLAMLIAPALFAAMPSAVVIGGSGAAVAAIGLAGLWQFAGRAAPRDRPARFSPRARCAPTPPT